MHQDRAHTDGLGRSDCAQDRIGQEVCAEPFAMLCTIDRETPEQQDRHRVRHVATNFAGRNSVQNRARGEAVVADDAATSANHESA